MIPITSTRNLFDVRVGLFHTLEILLQIRSSDIDWWNANLQSHERQFFKLISRRVIPDEFGDEIRTDIKHDETKASEHAGVREKHTLTSTIGEFNLKKITAKRNNTTKAEDGLKKRKQKTNIGGRSSAKKTKVNGKKSMNEKQHPSAPLAETNTCSNDDDDAAISSEMKEKRLKLLRESGKWIFGKSLQACYITEEIDRSSMSSLVFCPFDLNSESNVISTQHVHGTNINSALNFTQTSSFKDSKELQVPIATFQSWKKLSKRLNIWVFKFDQNDPTDLSVSENGGFPRPELLPLSDIFRPSYHDTE